MLIVYPFCSMFQYILNNTPFYLPICQLMGIWVGFCFSLGGFVLFLCLCFCFCVLLLWIAFIYKFLCGHMFYIFLGIYLRVKSYGIWWTFWGAVILFSMVTLFYILSDNVWWFRFFHILAKTYYCLPFLLWPSLWL